MSGDKYCAATKRRKKGAERHGFICFLVEKTEDWSIKRFRHVRRWLWTDATFSLKRRSVVKKRSVRPRDTARRPGGVLLRSQRVQSLVLLGARGPGAEDGGLTHFAFLVLWLKFRILSSSSLGPQCCWSDRPQLPASGWSADSGTSGSPVADEGQRRCRWARAGR